MPKNSESPFSPENMRARFADLTAQREAIDKKLNPLRQKLDEAVADEDLTVGELKKIEADVRPKIKALQEELYPIENERGTLARALGGWTSGDAPADAEEQRAAAVKAWEAEFPEEAAKQKEEQRKALEGA